MDPIRLFASICASDAELSLSTCNGARGASLAAPLLARWHSPDTKAVEIGKGNERQSRPDSLHPYRVQESQTRNEYMAVTILVQWLTCSREPRPGGRQWRRWGSRTGGSRRRIEPAGGKGRGGLPPQQQRLPLPWRPPLADDWLVRHARRRLGGGGRGGMASAIDVFLWIVFGPCVQFVVCRTVFGLRLGGWVSGSRESGCHRCLVGRETGAVDESITAHTSIRNTTYQKVGYFAVRACLLHWCPSAQ